MSDYFYSLSSLLAAAYFNDCRVFPFAATVVALDEEENQ